MMRPDHGTTRPAYQPIDFDAALRRKRSTMDETVAMLEAQAKESAAWLVEQRRDGIIPPAEKIILDCLRSLMSIPKPEREGADILIDHISRAYLITAHDSAARMRRAHVLLLLVAAEETRKKKA